jgi:glucose-1-phosphate cytidylyltransferase
LKTAFSEIPVFVLCGGLGTRLREETELRPKPMVPVGGRPILWHIMRSYASHGFRKFVLCLGYKAEVVKSYFLNYASLSADFTVELKSNRTTVHSIGHDRYLGDAKQFAVTYGDGLTDANLAGELEFHLAEGRIGTVLGVNPPSRFGELRIEGNGVEEFSEKPDFADSWINGGYFFFRRDFLPYLSADEGCVLEREPLVHLARDRQLSIFRHRGYWACMDTQRDREQLDKVWASGKAPWAP